MLVILERSVLTLGWHFDEMCFMRHDAKRQERFVSGVFCRGFLQCTADWLNRLGKRAAIFWRVIEIGQRDKRFELPNGTWCDMWHIMYGVCDRRWCSRMQAFVCNMLHH